jgi:hypothetical protein
MWFKDASHPSADASRHDVPRSYKATVGLDSTSGRLCGAYTMRDCPDLIAMLAKQKVDGKLVGGNGETPSIVLASIHGFLHNGATCFPLIVLCNKMPREPQIMMWLCMITLSHPKVLQVPCLCICSHAS